ncbi:MAG: S8 family serine peptidase, partial [Lachnospiraceae bacterium]|nr:S8 family serine peptidase [Lachnospiraceae bacterium]
MKPKRLIKSSIAFTLAFTMVLTSGIVANANELNGSEKYTTISENIKDILPKQTEEIKQVNSIEELDTNDTIVKESDSIFKSCRLIIYSDKEMEFDNDYIKSVQKYDNFYVVEYASVKDTEDSYNNYKEDGIDVEIDEVKDTPEIVENKANKNTEAEEDVSKEEIATTNTDKDKQNIDEANADSKIVTVAILDTGLNAGEDIFDNRIVEGKNFVDGDNTNDNNGHGTAMSKIMLEETNDQEVITKIMPIKVLNDEGVGTTLSAYKGIKYAIEKNVDVINLSLSGLGKSKLLESAINDAINHNIPVVVSAGNDNKEITEYTPANIESTITVSSTENIDNKYTKTIYSNFGSDTNNIDFATKGFYEYTRTINNKQVNTSISGTSVSSAYVTSYVALLKQLALTDDDENNDNLNFNDIYNSLVLSSTKINETNSDYTEKENKYYFGNGYLDKSNFVIQKSEEEVTPLPVEEVKETDENITLNTQATNRFMSACIIDGHGFYNSSKGLEALAAQSACGYASSWEDKGAFLDAILGTYITDYQNHTITFNDAFEMDNKGATINLYGTKTVNCVDSDGVSGDGIGEKSADGYAPAVTVNGNITFVGGSLSSAKAQDSTNLSYINLNEGVLNYRPALENNGTVTLNNTGLRAGSRAEYVVKNNAGHTMTLTGGGASIGAANASASKPNIINEGTLTISENSTKKYQLDKSYTPSGFQNSEAIRNNGTLYVTGGVIGHATVGIKNNTTNAYISGGTIFACSVGIENASSKRLNQSSGSITSNTYGVVNNSGATYIKS